MRRSRRIYKRKSRSNLETLIILIGAIIILSVAFYMAREKSFIPPEEITTEQQMSIAERETDENGTDQKTIEELLAQKTAGTDQDMIDQQGMTNQDQDIQSVTPEQERVSAEESTVASAEQTLPQAGNDAEFQTDTVSPAREQTASQEQAIDEIAQSTTSGLVYTVQVGYFSIESNARGLATEIENHGFQAFLLKHNNAYKVQVGAYQTREQAERTSQQLKNLGYEIWITQR